MQTSPGFAGGIYDSTDLGPESLGLGGRLSRLAQQAAPAAAVGAGAIGGLATGNPGALLGLIPGGGMIGGLASIGAGGADGVRDQLDGFTDAFRDGLEALPEILSEVIPDFASTIVGELIPSLIKASPEIFISLIEGLSETVLSVRLFKNGGLLDDAFGGVEGETDDVYESQFVNNIEANLNDRFYGGSSNARSVSSIIAPRAPLQMNPSAGVVQYRFSAEEVGSLLVDTLDLTIGPNGSRPGHSFGGG